MINRAARDDGIPLHPQSTKQVRGALKEQSRRTKAGIHLGLMINSISTMTS